MNKKPALSIMFSCTVLFSFLTGSCNLFSVFQQSSDETLFSSSEYTPVYFSPGEPVFEEIPRNNNGDFTSAVLGEEESEVYLLFTNVTQSALPGPSPDLGRMTRTQRNTYFMNRFTPDLKSTSRGYSVDDPASSFDYIFSNAISDYEGKTTDFTAGVPSDEDVRFWEINYTGGNTLVPLEIDAQCILVVEKSLPGGETQLLSIWVADDSYGSGSGLIDDDMVQALGDAFLNPGSPGIYEWETELYGQEWGQHSYVDLIRDYDQGGAWSQIPGVDGPETDCITILLYDIDGDGLPQSGEGRVFGYFKPLDLFARDFAAYHQVEELEYSSERVMFYLDAPLFAQEDPNDSDDIWTIEDYRPRSIVSTLAHEFQHMINYYQKRVSSGFDFQVETWLNEMMSMVTEDLLSSKMNVPGPRGVDPADGTAGPSDNTSGRLPLYVFAPEDSLTDWGSAMAQQLQSYSTAYSYGAYLARNFGGAEFFRYVMEAPDGGSGAIEYALGKIEEVHPSIYQGAGELSFRDTVTRWGVANLLSDLESPIRYASINSNGWYTDTLGYQLGSINMYNYRQYNFLDDLVLDLGLNIFTQPDALPDLHGSYGNMYYLLGSSLSGTVEIPFDLPSGVTVTLIRR